MNSSNSSNRGCLIAAFVVAAVLVLGVAAAAAVLFQFKARQSKMVIVEETQMAHEEIMRMDPASGGGGPVVVIAQSNIGNYSPTEFGETLEAKHFVAIACAPNLTSLAKQKFVEAAEEMPIEWLVRIEDIQENPGGGGQISGQFSMPYEIRERHSSFGSAIRVSATFPAEQSNELISLRSGDLIQIRGKLNIPNNDTNSVRLIDPEILTGNDQSL